jgi:CDP-glucose 4,6-dehydratase
VLDACRQVPGVRAIVVVTTDKVYQNQEHSRGYREDDRLGGHDPYSASKAAAEIVVDSYRKAYLGAAQVLVASARAGNVIGGGDWSEDRLIPDLVRAAVAGSTLEIRSPNSTRPWQHVLESLSGYLLLGAALLRGETDCADAYNFGPDPVDNRRVAEVLALLQPHWPALRWELSRQTHPHEAGLLYLDNSKVRKRLGWRPVWDLERGVVATAEWYRAYHDEGRLLTRAQLAQFVDSARDAGQPWART